MKYNNNKQYLWILVTFLFLFACTSKFDLLENKEPDWLGPNIYDYLKNRGDCNYYVKLIEDCGYKESMQRTGSMTLFFSKDDAFERFFKNNNLGITSYEIMPQSLKYMLIRIGILNDAQLVERMSYDDKGRLILRRATAFSWMDSIPLVPFEKLPVNKWFEPFRGQSIPLAQDNSNWTLVQFFQKNLESKNMSDEDFEAITGQDRSYGDAYIFSSKIIQKDIVCKNGYLDELEDLFFPPDNMAGFIRSNPNISVFNHLMDRFAVPVHTTLIPGTEIYTLRYFNKSSVAGANYTTDPEGKTVDGALLYDPGWNSYQALPNVSTAPPAWQTDMGVMFVPTNEAIDAYFQANGEGSDLYEAFGGNWDNVPNSIVADFIANHQKYSFFASIPSFFPTMKDESGYDMSMKKENIVGTYVARNGLVYIVNKVFPPLDYRSIMGPVKIDEKSKIFQSAISTDYCQYVYYLRSIYNWFNFFVLQDQNMKGYLDPVALNYPVAQRARLDFFITPNGAVAARRMSLETGDSIGVITDRATIVNRLNDILDQQTIIGQYNPGQEYYITKSGAPIHITGITPGSKVEGVGNKEQGNQATILNTIEKTNGLTFYLDRIIEQSTTSTYAVLSSKPEFSEFFKLCDYAGFFIRRPTQSTTALNYKISFFDLYHYTIYVPTNDAMVKAHSQGLYPSVDDLDAAYSAGDQEVFDAMMYKLERFLRYHFQDNSVIVKGEQITDKQYLSATLNTETNKFYPLFVTNANGHISIRSQHGETVNVVTTNPNLYNLMSRDIVVDTTNPEALLLTTKIETSSWVVIHQIDDVLRIE